MTDLVALRAANLRRWSAAKVTRNFTSIARRLVAAPAKAQYQLVSERTGVPWAMIAVIHEREASQNWAGSLAQGDPWNRVSVHVPAGRGPFKSWVDAAVDALVNCQPHAARNKDWSIGGTLTMLEQYNGLGYFNGPVTKRDGVVIARYPSQPSPYIWSGTDQYKAGKYVRDGVFDPHAIDQQAGCASLLLAMIALDPTITFTGVTIVPAPVAITPVTPSIVTPAPPSITNPAKGSIGAAIASLFSKLFGRKS